MAVYAGASTPSLVCTMRWSHELRCENVSPDLYSSVNNDVSSTMFSWLLLPPPAVQAWNAPMAPVRSASAPVAPTTLAGLMPPGCCGCSSWLLMSQPAVNISPTPTAAAIVHRARSIWLFIRVSSSRVLVVEIQADNVVRRGRDRGERVLDIARAVVRFGIDPRVRRPHVQVAGREHEVRTLRAAQHAREARGQIPDHRNLAQPPELPVLPVSPARGRLGVARGHQPSLIPQRRVEIALGVARVRLLAIERARGVGQTVATLVVEQDVDAEGAIEYVEAVLHRHQVPGSRGRPHVGEGRVDRDLVGRDVAVV